MRRLAAMLVLLVLAGAWWPSTASASTGNVGWWTRSPLASAPEGGFTVGNAPDGPLSVAAVELDLGDTGVSSGTLSFEQVPGGAPPGPGQLVACLTSSGFEAAAGGPIEEAPATTCDSLTVPAAMNGTSWSVQVGDLVGDRKGTVAIALVPVTGGTGLWDVQLEAPSFRGTPARPSSSSTGGRSPVTTMATSRPTTAAGPSTFAVRKPPTVAAPASTTTTVAADEQATATTVAVANLATDSSFATDGESEGRPVGQAMTMVGIAAVVGIVAGVAHKVAAARLAA